MNVQLPSCMVVMGVSGCGKTTFGRKFAMVTDSFFIEGDELHSPGNIQKMRAGIPLNDEDRAGWLESIARETANRIGERKKVVVSCSALKKSYRDLLRSHISDIVFVYLKIDYAEALKRLERRKKHFMPASLLKSQFDTLEEPGVAEPDVLIVHNQGSANETVSDVVETFKK